MLLGREGAGCDRAPCRQTCWSPAVAGNPMGLLPHVGSAVAARPCPQDAELQPGHPTRGQCRLSQSSVRAGSRRGRVGAARGRPTMQSGWVARPHANRGWPHQASGATASEAAQGGTREQKRFSLRGPRARGRGCGSGAAVRRPSRKEPRLRARGRGDRVRDRDRQMDDHVEVSVP